MGKSVRYYTSGICSGRGSDLTFYSSVPTTLREKYVLSSYRPVNKAWSYYFRSIFQLHNETFNIWTHIIGFFVLAYKLSGLSETYDAFNDNRSVPILMFGICCMFTHAFSVFAHTVHSKSSYIHCFVILVDYMGVVLSIFGCCILALHSCSDTDAYAFFLPYYMPLAVINSLITYVAFYVMKMNFYEEDAAFKRRMFQIICAMIEILLFTLPIVPRYVKCFKADGCSLSSLNHISVNYVTIAMAAFFFTSHVPQRLNPGAFDIVGQGHQIFHIFCTTTHVLSISAAHKDIQDGHVLKVSQSFGSMMIYFVFLCFAMVIFIFYVERFISGDGKNRGRTARPSKR